MSRINGLTSLETDGEAIHLPFPALKLLLGPCSATQCESRQGKFWKEQLMTQRCCESKETLHISNLILTIASSPVSERSWAASIAPECRADSARVFLVVSRTSDSDAWPKGAEICTGSSCYEFAESKWQEKAAVMKSVWLQSDPSPFTSTMVKDKRSKNAVSKMFLSDKCPSIP